MSMLYIWWSHELPLPLQHFQRRRSRRRHQMKPLLYNPFQTLCGDIQPHIFILNLLFNLLYLSWLQALNCMFRQQNQCIPQRKKCPYSELFWSTFFLRFTSYLSVFSPNAGKMRTRITLNTDSFYAVFLSSCVTIRM